MGKKNKKLIILCSIYDVRRSGGLSSHVNLLMKGIKNKNFNVEIITPYNILNFISYKFLVEIPRNIIFLICKDLGILYYYFISIIILRIKLKTLLKKKDILAINFQDVVSFQALNNIKNIDNIRKVLTVHGDLTNMCLSDNVIYPNFIAHKNILNTEYNAYKNADYIVAVDTRLHNHIKSISGRDSLIQKNFVDITKFYPFSNLKIQELKKKFGFPTNKKIIFCPRRLVHKNGVIYSVKAMQFLSEKYVLIICGVGPELNNIKNFILKNNLQKKVIILGDINHNYMPIYYNISDYVTIPSITSFGVIEATSISCLEAMACGKVVIASNIGGLKELIINKYNGILVSEKKPKEIADAIKNITPKMYKYLSTNSIAYIKSNHNYINSTENFIKLYLK